MKRAPLILSSMLLGLGCRPDTDDQTEMEHADVDGMPDGDAGNCGELGLNCVGALGIGDCVNGQCQARLPAVCTGSGTCEALCGSVGMTCAELGCEGATAFGFNGSTQEEADVRCLDAMVADATPLTTTCTEEPAAMTWLCCCE